MKSFTLRTAQWPQDSELIRSVREQVFVIEQGIDPAIEWTGDDDQYHSVLALNADQNPIGTGRIGITAGIASIGRMAVLKEYRGAGTGTEMLNRLIEIGKDNGAEKFELSAQLTAIDFYQKQGFIPVGDVYIEADIKHQKMYRC